MLIHGEDGRDHFDPCHGRLPEITAAGRQLDALLPLLPRSQREAYLMQVLAQFDCPDEVETMAIRFHELRLRQAHGLPDPSF